MTHETHFAGANVFSFPNTLKSWARLLKGGSNLPRLSFYVLLKVWLKSHLENPCSV